VTVTRTTLRTPARFFADVRAAGLLGSSLDQGEVDGLNAILHACGGAGWGKRFTAYALATADHETAGTMQPIRERGSREYLTRLYDIAGRDPARARRYGNTRAGDGVRYCGRGYVQLTWRANYEVATRELRKAGINVDLVENPDLAMRPDVAAFVMVNGMQHGWFTGVKLGDFITSNAYNFVKARKVINGLDCAEQIAHEAGLYLAALTGGDWGPA